MGEPTTSTILPQDWQGQVRNRPLADSRTSIRCVNRGIPQVAFCGFVFLIILALGIETAAPKNSLFAPEQVQARLQAAFDVSPAPHSYAAIRASAWARINGRKFIATACVLVKPPRIGCGEFADMAPQEVTLLPIRSQTNEDEYALQMGRRLDGHWLGEDVVLNVDYQRAQANMNASAAFEWGRFLIRRVSGDTVVFSINGELFQATFSSDGIALSGTTLRRERFLRRQ